MCTVHSFPHNIDHCLTFARSEFEGHLEKAPAEANAFLLQPTNYLQVLAVFAVVCLDCRDGVGAALALSAFGSTLLSTTSVCCNMLEQLSLVAQCATAFGSMSCSN